MSAPAEEKKGGLLTSAARLHKIDQLRDKNIGQYVPLPQLVVVGDQSSGKSSLLEGLTGIPFPRGQELCTRYVTQITHRRERDACINVSIIPGPGASASEKLKLEAYHKCVATTSQLHDEFPSILEEVNELMGIRSSQNPNGTKTFTEDVLKIQKCGPNEDYLTVIDVPGLFQDTVKDVTTENDKIMVHNMVVRYIRDDQTIILAVLSCLADLATQAILSLAEQYDPTGQRTVGILTKPDLLLEKSGRDIVCSLIKGEKRPLNLGYHLVRSRGGDDKGGAFGDDERDIMFKTEPWSTLPSDRLGVVALRQRLQNLLDDLTDRAFPRLRSETRRILQQAKEDLAKLGKSRQTGQEQQQFLVTVAGEFQSLVRAALSADYSSRAVFDDDKFRLITNVMNATDEFKTDFTMSAHTYEFHGDKCKDDEDDEGDEGDEDDVDHESSDGKDALLDQFPDLDSVIVRERSDDAPMQGIMEWITGIHRRSRGTEPVSFNPTLFSTALRQQTSKWRAQTEYYVSRVIYMIHEFLVGALEVACPDKRAREELLSQLLNATLERYETGLQHARFLVGVERDGYPYTLNDYFRSKLADLQSTRTESQLGGKVRSITYDKWGNKKETPSINFEDVQSTLREKDGGKYIAEEVHDLIKSYYEVARDRFIDNVYLQSITHSLISGESSPLRLFSEQWVLNLESDRLEAIAGESLQTREQRTRLAKRIQEVTEAVAILR